MGYGDAFDRLFVRGSEAVRAGDHHRDTPPVDGGRWGISVVMRPPPGMALRLGSVTRQALAVAGEGHWPTGSAATVHITVWALERHRIHVPDDDPAVATYAAALRAAAGSAPVRLRFDGLTLTPNGVMACAYPLDGAAAAASAGVAAALGDRGWLEAGVQRDIWYATLVHFTGPIPDSSALVGWVAARRRLDLGEATLDELVLADWRFDGGRPALRPLVVAPLDGHR